MSTEHICRFCGKLYVRRKSYQQHMLMCEISKKGIEGIEGGKSNVRVPSNTELYQIIITLNDKYDRLKEDYDGLKRFVDGRRRKIDVLEWLNKNCVLGDEGNDFESVFMNMRMTVEHLRMVFENDYVNGIADILGGEIAPRAMNSGMGMGSCMGSCPHTTEGTTEGNCGMGVGSNCATSDNGGMGSCLRAFSHKEGVFYIYAGIGAGIGAVDGSIVWRIMENDEFDRLIRCIDKKLLMAFQEWQTETKKTMDEDKFAEIYIKNLKKVMGGNFKTYDKNTKIRNRLYKAIKTDVKNIMVYEF